MSSHLSPINSTTRAIARAPEAQAKKTQKINIKPGTSPTASSNISCAEMATLARNLQKSDGHLANRLGAINLQSTKLPGFDQEIKAFIKYLKSNKNINTESLQNIDGYIQKKEQIKLENAINFFFAVRKLDLSSNSQLNSVTTKICEIISYKLNKTLQYFPCTLPFRTLSSLCKALRESNYSKNKELSSFVFSYLKKKIAEGREDWTAKQAVNFFSLFSKTLAISSRDKEMPIIKKFMNCINKNLNNLKLKECVTASWCALKLNITNLEYFNAVRTRIHPFINDLKAKDLAYITRDLSQLYTEDDSTLLALLDEIKKRVECNIECYELNDLVAIAHVICIKICQQDVNYSEFINFFKFLCDKIDICLAKEDSLNDYTRNEIKAIFIIYDQLINGDRLSNIEKIAQSKSNDPKPKHKISSELHDTVENELKIFLHGFQNPKSVGKLLIFKHEYPLAHYQLDIAFPYAKAAIEIDGPCHFDESGHYLLETARKTKILELLGYLIIRISHTEWNESQDKKALLRSKLMPLIQKLEEAISKTYSPKILEEWQSIKTKLSV